MSLKSNKLDIPEALQNAGKAADSDLAKALLGIVAVGVAGGSLLVGAGLKLGEYITSREKKSPEDEDKESAQ